MLAIMKAESGCIPAKNNLTMSENHGVCVGSYGLLQIGCLHFSGDHNRNDPATNIAVGYQVWKKQGYKAWTVYRTGAYKKYL